jgi:hypothetical protein
MTRRDANGRKRGKSWKKNMKWCDGHRQVSENISCQILHIIFLYSCSSALGKVV